MPKEWIEIIQIYCKSRNGDAMINDGSDESRRTRKSADRNSAAKNSKLSASGNNDDLVTVEGRSNYFNAK
jgi:hypothetical protein